MIVVYRIFDDLFAFNGEGLTDDEVFVVQQNRVDRYAKVLEAEFKRQFPSHRFDVYSVVDAKNAGMQSDYHYTVLSQNLDDINERLYNEWKVDNLPLLYFRRA